MDAKNLPAQPDFNKIIQIIEYVDERGNKRFEGVCDAWAPGLSVEGESVAEVIGRIVIEVPDNFGLGWTVLSASKNVRHLLFADYFKAMVVHRDKIPELRR